MEKSGNGLCVINPWLLIKFRKIAESKVRNRYQIGEVLKLGTTLARVVQGYD